MPYHKLLVFSVLLAAISVGGCASTARDTTGYKLTDSATVNAGMMETWQTTKAVLREMELDIYTRDKRGVFVAYEDMDKRWLIFRPKRTQLTISLERVAAETTKVNIETVRQVYGSTLMTYPDWHDRQAKDDEAARHILEAVQQRLS